jgi:stage V sporulation protein B
MSSVLKKEAFGLTRRLLKRDFSGNSGMAIKNSIYSFLTSAVAKIGSLLFTALIVGSSFLTKFLSLFSIEIKPLLTPELFGLYSLALSTILIFAGFSDLGIGNAMVRYISKKGINSGGYIAYLAKIKITLTIVVSLVLIASSYFIASYYQKPIFLALLAGSIYIIALSLMTFISGFFQAENNFRIMFFREILFQILRLIIVPIVIIYSLAYSDQIVLFSITFSLAICYFIALLFLKLNLKKYHGKKLDNNQKNEIKKFLLPLSATALSGAFFGYIDIIMLGRFVGPIYIAYYQAAFALISSATILLSFNSVLFPIFSRLKGARLIKGLQKSIIVTIPLSIIGMILTILLARPLITLLYNSDYLPGVLILQLLSILFLTDPLINIYFSFLISEGRSSFVGKALVITTLINIILNYILITNLLPLGDYMAVLGAVFSTILSRFVYLGIFIFHKKFNN